MGEMEEMEGNTTRANDRLFLDLEAEVKVEKLVFFRPFPSIFYQDLFAKIAKLTGETLESVCQMQEEERNALIEALDLKQVEQLFEYLL